MLLSEFIAKAQKLLAAEGDLEMLSGGEYTCINGISLLEVEEDDQFPKDWNMPRGSKFALVDYDC